jgi:DNA-binding SARP family transcriptional activator/tetratricopeptide (TPR) repeat protein
MGLVVLCRILGPLEVNAGGEWASIGAAKWRALLAVLVTKPGEVVSTERLIDELWGDEPPLAARKLVSGYVLRLRRLTGDADGHVLATRAPGYRVMMSRADVDACRFEDLLGAGRHALATDPGKAADLLAEALGLWRGPALMDVPRGLLVTAEADRLNELRLAAQELRIEASIRCGRQVELVPELRGLTAGHPLREQFWHQLMRVLAGCGRPAEALDVYGHVRDLLADALGADPGPDLQQLYHRILAGDPQRTGQRPDAQLRAAGPEPQETQGGTLAVDPGFLEKGSAQLANVPGSAVPDAGGRAAAAGRVLPRQLPASVCHFTGRAAELAELDGLLEDAAGEGAALVISAIDGMAGIGKTALAVHWAHQVAGRFPDGQLYVNLRGFGPSGAAVTPAEAIRGFLDAFEVPPERIPSSLDAQAALYRSLLAGQRMLVLLDNARGTEQVRPLLPGSPGCLVVVTSRAQLTGLAAGEAARLLTLGLLTEGESAKLLASRLGAGRVDSEPGPVSDLIRLCARLPLALSIAAARASSRPGFKLAAVAAELRQAQGRLDALDVGGTSSVRTVFSWSYAQLGFPAAMVFRLLGLHPGPDISLPAAASLAGISRAEAAESLNELTQAHLLTEPVPGRFTFHDLLRAYAADRAAAEEGEPGRRAALHRMFDHYLHSAYAADRCIYPERDPISLAPARPGVLPESFPDRARSLAWFEAEKHVLLALTVQAGVAGHDVHAWQIPWALVDFFDWGGHWAEWAATHHTALAAARRLGDHDARAHAHHSLANALARLGSHEDAGTHLRQALDLFRQLGDLAGQARVHVDLVRAFGRQGQYGEALRCAGEAVRLFQAVGNKALEGGALNAVGWCHAKLGHHQEAITWCERALMLQQECGVWYGAAYTWDSLGYIHLELGHHTEAAACYRHSLDLAREVGDRQLQATALTYLGDTHQATGDPDAAHGAWQQALVILDDLKDPDADEVRARFNRLDEITSSRD